MAKSDGRPGAELLTWLSALRNVSAASTSSADLGQVLNLIAETARDLLGFDFVGVLTPDAAGESLLISGWSGLSADYVGRVNSDRPIGVDSGSPSGRAFRSGQAVALRDISAEPEFTPWGGVAREQSYRAIVCVPLMADGQVLGTLNGYYSPVHTFTGAEMERLTLLANHAAIALTSASRLEQLRHLNDSLRDQRDALTRSARIHEQLLAVTLRSGGLSGIAAVLAELIGRPVLIDDAADGVLATAGQTADLPDAHWRAGAVIPIDIGSAPTPVSTAVGDDTGAPRSYFVSVARLDQDVAARVWFPAGDAPLDPVGVRAVEHASIVVSLELLRVRTAAEVEHRLRGELLADLLGGPGLTEQLVARAQRLGHDLRRPHAVIVGTLNATGQPADGRGYRRALALVSALARSQTPRPLTAMHRGDIVTLWPLAEDTDAPAPASSTRDTATSVHRAMSTSAGGVATVAVSSRVGATFETAYRITKGALDIAVRAGRTNTVVQLEELGVVGLLLQLDDPAALTEFADRTVGPLTDYDTAHHTELVLTLRTYFANKLDRATTAEALHVHPNTVAQRLRRIAVLCDADLTDPSVVVNLGAALTVHDVISVG